MPKRKSQAGGGQGAFWGWEDLGQGVSSLDGECPVLGFPSGHQSQEGDSNNGVVYTRAEVVEFILDLVGYTSDRPLHQLRILEPSIGSGSFLFPVVERLLKSYSRCCEGDLSKVEELAGAIQAFELQAATFEATREALLQRLSSHHVSDAAANALAEKWLVHGDFLLSPQSSPFDFVVGNPPYVRQELIPDILLSEYRRRYHTLYDRADLYIPFIERSLSLLNDGGTLGFICADRWMKNRYGGPLRKFVADGFHLSVYVDMVGTDAFETDVSTYTAITVLTRSRAGITRIIRRPVITRESLQHITDQLATTHPEGESPIREVSGVVQGQEPWLLDSTDEIALIRRLEEAYPTLEQAGCKVGIGVATGSDQAYIGKFDLLNVEPDRKLPLVSTSDITSGEVVWGGLGVINPFTDSGKLVALQDFPRLAAYLEERREVIAGRHCAKKNEAKWYRTIDRIWPELTNQPKLLIPDIKGESHIVFEPGGLYPHHNLYYVTSEAWDLRALQAVLLSSIGRIFIANYSTKIRGGYLRFQAQYLRRIRLPHWREVPSEIRNDLIEAANNRDRDACNELAGKLYHCSPKELRTLCFCKR